MLILHWQYNLIMEFKMKKLYTIISTILIISSIYAGDVSRKGTTGADQLLIPVGARGIATGGAFLASLTGLESIYYNPAGLDLSKSTEAMFSYMNYVADINVSYFAASASLGEVGSFALSLKSLDFGEIPVTTADFPDGTGSTYSPSYITVALTYSKIITDRISVGTNIKLISERIMNTSATGFGFDAGVQYKFNERLSIGASIKNIGANMVYSGADLQGKTTIPGTDLGTVGGTYEIVSEEFQIPSYFELSASYNYNFNEQNNVLLGSTFVANNSLEDLLNLGAEYSFMNILFLRGGYNLLVSENISNESIFGFTAGAGVEYKIGEDIKASFDYAFREVKEFPTANHVFTVKLALQ